jgi:hypothetical protein
MPVSAVTAAVPDIARHERAGSSLAGHEQKANRASVISAVGRAFKRCMVN